MSKKRALFLFLISGSIVLGIAVASLFFVDSRDAFQKKNVDATLLNRGETGKILKDLKRLVPVENKSKDPGPETNVLEIIARAAQDRQKWARIDKFKEYRDKGVFCYFEIDSPGPDIHFTALSKRGGKWQKDLTFYVSAKRYAYSFFLEGPMSELYLQLSFLNKEQPFTLKTAVFLQHGYHPVVYSDPLSFKRFISIFDNTLYTITDDGVVFPPQTKVKRIRSLVPFKEDWMVGISKFRMKQGSTQIEMTPEILHPLRDSEVSDGALLAEESRDKLPVIAVDVEEEDLYSDEYGILKNWDEHGRRWERLALVRYYEDGEEQLKSFSGIRLQGGDPGREKGLINFRLFFREEYGRSVVDSSILFEEPFGDLKRLAIKQSEWEKWPLNSPIAYDTSRQIGALAPPTEPVNLFLNGKKLGLYYIVPHLGENQLERMLPEGDYQYYRYRGAQHPADRLYFNYEFWLKMKNLEEWTAEHVGQFFDLDNLTRQLFSYAFNGTGDYCQGIALKDIKPGSKMFWYSWDMDHSFIDVDVEVRAYDWIVRPRHQQPPVTAHFFKEGDFKHFCPRVQLFRRLVNEDLQFRIEVRDKFVEFLNHRVTEEYISDLLADYRTKLNKGGFAYTSEYLGIIEEFFPQRRQFIFNELAALVESSPGIECRVQSDLYPMQVDGYTKSTEYIGTYFPGMTIRLLANDMDSFQHWLVAGKKFEESVLEFVAEEGKKCLIQAVHK